MGRCDRGVYIMLHALKAARAAGYLIRPTDGATLRARGYVLDVGREASASLVAEFVAMLVSTPHVMAPA
jgi:hypothetical protein